jgi:uncharacterized protein (TIGR03083 family)
VTGDRGLWLSALRREGVAFRKAAAATEPETEVVSCPGWTMRRLVSHLSRVHRGSALTVVRGVVEPPVLAPRPPDDGLLEWYDDGLDQVIEALESVRPDLPAWNFAPAAPQIAGFWQRRMAHETAMHRWDAELTAYGRPDEHDRALAADGAGEVLEVLLARQAQQEPLASARGTLAVGCTDTRDFWLVRIEPGGQVETERTETLPTRVDARITGPAGELYLLLWGRRRPDELPGVGFGGDRGFAGLIHAS